MDSNEPGEPSLASQMQTSGPAQPSVVKQDSPISRPFSAGENIELMPEGAEDGQDFEMRPTMNINMQAVLDKQREIADQFRTRAAGGAATKKGKQPIIADYAAEIARPVSKRVVEDDGDDDGDFTQPTHSYLVKKARPPGAEERDIEAEKFEKIKERYYRMKRLNTLDIEDELAFLQAESTENSRLRKISMDNDWNRSVTPEDANGNEEGLFVEQEDAMPSYPAPSDDDEPKRKRRGPFTEESDEETGRKGKKPKRAAKAAKSRKASTGYTEQDFEDIISGSRRQTAKVAPPKSSKAAGRSTAAGRKKSGGPTMTNISSLMGADVFTDAQKTAGLAQQPTFDASTKRDVAMKQLIASVPQEDQTIAKSDQKYLDDAIKAFTGQGSVKPAPDGHWQVAGMKAHLKHYQVLGTAFMRKRENASREPKGGILADTMGLGKTVMMLANIVNGKPNPGSKRRATLVVASPALVSQWYNEIRVHCKTRREDKAHGIGRVIRHQAGNRVVSNDAEDLLSEADIVLTTYTEVCKSYPKVVIPPELTTAQQKERFWAAHYEANKGLLHRTKFLRVVLDEAQAIKNHKSHTSLACRGLQGKYHWAITGTPLMNTVAEFYPYFKFLREPNTGSYRLFKSNFCDGVDGTEKLNALLRIFLIRRTYLDRLFNAKLLDLPEPEHGKLWVYFNDVERQIYEIVKRRMILRINAIAKQGGLDNQCKHIFSMILRLRQICTHFLLIQGPLMDLLEREDFEKLNNITEQEEDANEEGITMLQHLRHVLKAQSGVKKIDGGNEYDAAHTDVADTAQTQEDIGGKHGLSFRFRRYLNELVRSEHWDAITQRSLCCGCRQPPENPYVTSCFHIYCLSCLNDLAHLSARRGHDQTRCSECGDTYRNVQPCEGLETFQTRPASSSTASAANDSAAKPSPKAKAKQDGMQDWIGMPGEVCPSAKSVAAKAQILKWLEEEPDGKIIVYTQWLAMIRIMAKVCQTERWDYCEYHGKMSHEAREKAIIEFSEKKEKKILLASLRCGGVGLNLTAASRVLLIDPWFNEAVELQAFHRVFRIGQNKKTQLMRVVCHNSIDEDMVAMKERKKAEIEEVMDDPKRNQSISVKELMRLFGRVGEDDDGMPFIFPDPVDDEYPDHARVPDDEEDFVPHDL